MCALLAKKKPSHPQDELGRALYEALGPSGLLWEPHDVRLYSYDAVAKGISPRFVVLPTTTEQVVQVVRLANSAGLPIIARGGGTCLSGGPVPLTEGIVIALTRMNKILQVDTQNERVILQPGVVLQNLIDTLNPLGYFYAPDPSSQTVCTLGGNIGENSGGPHCLKYGVTVNHITGLELVLADGSIARTGGILPETRAYDLTGLFIGSEGTLGIATEITCRILPQPEAVNTMLVIFNTIDAASQAVSGTISTGLLPATVEMMDRPLITAVQAAFDAGYPEDAQVVLIIELDGPEAGMMRQISAIREVCTAHGATSFSVAQTPEDRARLWKGRKGAFAAAARLAPNRLCTDISVPRGELPAVLHEIMELGRQHDILIGNVFHAGDGNLHPQVMYDARDPEQVVKVEKIDEEIIHIALQHGGAVTGEHGIGLCKRKWVKQAFSVDDTTVAWRLKRQIDPACLLNPGKLLDDEPVAGTIPPVAQFEILTDQVFCPESEQNAAQLLSSVSASESSIYITGSHPQASEEHPVLCTCKLQGKVVIDRDNMTVTAPAGLTWATLQAELAQAGEWIPMYVGRADELSVGSVLAQNPANPGAVMYGELRDLITGLQFITTNGEFVSAGGSCVKNVSGYALEKLLIGSQGTLGLITQAILRTRQLPELQQTLILYSADAPSALALQNISQSLRLGRQALLTVNLCSAELLFSQKIFSDTSADLSGWFLLIASEGLKEEVDVALNHAQQISAEFGFSVLQQLEGATHTACWNALADITDMLQISVPTGNIGGFVAECTQEISGLTALRADFLNGKTLVSKNNMPYANSLLQQNISLYHGINDLLSSEQPDAGYLALCNSVKYALDPAGILPKRLHKGIYHD